MAMPAGTRQSNSILLIWMTTTPTRPLAAWQQHIQNYTTAKKHQLQLNQALGLLYSHEGQLLNTYYDNRPPGINPALDHLVAQLQLKGPEGLQHTPPPRSTHRRT